MTRDPLLQLVCSFVLAAATVAEVLIDRESLPITAIRANASQIEVGTARVQVSLAGRGANLAMCWELVGIHELKIPTIKAWLLGFEPFVGMIGYRSSNF